MKTSLISIARRAFCLVAAIAFFVAAADAQNKKFASKSGFAVPVEYYKLPNGLRVVLSPDRTAPTVTVAVYYKIGFRNEPRGRTGFAHLFEHMMFQGSQNLGKLEFIKLIQSNGGILNGSTRFDFTNYFEVVPSNKLETVLWAEADRMRGLNITEENLTNQKAVVINEVRVNILNRPYGGFPWLDMPQFANTNYFNAHNFYGDLQDIEAATLQDVREFFKTYYVPNNAALVVVGDFETAAAKRMIRENFGAIPAGKLPPAPDTTEPRQETERRRTKPDPLATRPAVAFGYHVPPRNTPEYYTFGLLNQLLLQGDDALLRQELVKRRAFAGSVDGNTNYLLGNMFDYEGPMLWIAALYHDANVSSEDIIKAADAVIERVRNEKIDRSTLARIQTKMRADIYNDMETLNNFGRADFLASFVLFDDDPAKINRLEAEFEKVTPELLQRTAQEYLRPTNRTILTIEPKAAETKQQGGVKQ